MLVNVRGGDSLSAHLWTISGRQEVLFSRIGRRGFPCRAWAETVELQCHKLSSTPFPGQEKAAFLRLLSGGRELRKVVEIGHLNEDIFQIAKLDFYPILR
ncbi:hypothetical protein chiPu_0001800 [Chiloscyllium punctatum]|uniref:Uncharacterized protein n=1 Tax=Chiloscyllium punctatum TaxID=137246 RepID=A0A401RZ30_CHIPU|nr:hypothetical protein [Chiloscyllium punctatum]